MDRERDNSPVRPKILSAQTGEPGDRSYLAEFLLQQLEKHSADSGTTKFGDYFSSELKSLIKPHFDAIDRIKLAPSSDNPNYENELAAQVFVVLLHDCIDPDQIKRTNFRDLSGATFVLHDRCTDPSKSFEMSVCGFSFSTRLGNYNSVDGESRLDRARLFLRRVQAILNCEFDPAPKLSGKIWDMIEFDQTKFLSTEQMKILLDLSGKTYRLGHKFATYAIDLPNGWYCELSPTTMIVRKIKQSYSIHDFVVTSIPASGQFKLQGSIRFVNHLYEFAFEWLSEIFKNKL